MTPHVLRHTHPPDTPQQHTTLDRTNIKPYCTGVDDALRNVKLQSCCRRGKCRAERASALTNGDLSLSGYPRLVPVRIYASAVPARGGEERAGTHVQRTSPTWGASWINESDVDQEAGEVGTPSSTQIN